MYLINVETIYLIMTGSTERQILCELLVRSRARSTCPRSWPGLCGSGAVRGGPRGWVFQVQRSDLGEDSGSVRDRVFTDFGKGGPS